MIASVQSPDTPRPLASVDALQETLRSTTEKLGNVTLQLSESMAGAGAIYATGTPAEQAAREREISTLTAERGRLELAVQSLHDQVEQAEYAARLQAAASVDAQLALGRERSIELVQDTARLVRQYDGKIAELFEVLAQLGDVEEEALAIGEQFTAHGRGAELAAALPTPPGQTTYGMRLHLAGAFERLPRGVEHPERGDRFHCLSEWRRDERAAH